MKNGLLIDVQYCTGCRSCEIACRNENSLGADEYGIKISQIGPFERANGSFVWNYYANVTQLCSLCAARCGEGEKAACELNCLAQVIERGPIEELTEKLQAKGKMACLLVP